MDFNLSPISQELTLLVLDGFNAVSPRFEGVELDFFGMFDENMGA